MRGRMLAVYVDDGRVVITDQVSLPRQRQDRALAEEGAVHMRSLTVTQLGR